MKILVGDHAFDAFKIEIGRRVRIGQHQGGIEDVQPLVFHGAEIEVPHRHNHKEVEVVFAAKGLFVPGHGAFQRVHGIERPPALTLVDKDSQGDLSPAHRHEPILQHVEWTGHQRKKVAGFWEGIFPDGKGATIRTEALVDTIAVAQQVTQRCRSFNGDAIARQDIGAIWIIGDFAKALGLALGAKPVARNIEPFQSRIGRGMDAHLGLEGKARRRAGQGQGFTVEDEVRFGHGRAVDLQAQQFKALAI